MAYRLQGLGGNVRSQAESARSYGGQLGLPKLSLGGATGGRPIGRVFCTLLCL